MDARLISLGTLPANPLWSESAPVRTGHATTTLIRAGGKAILVDPSLPEPALAARLHERTGLRPRDVTDVFLTTYKPDMTRGLRLFDAATWWIHDDERESAGVLLATTLRRAAEDHDSLSNGTAEDEPSPIDDLRERVAMLQRCKAAPQSLAERVDLFPLPGVTPGLCGLLLADARHTTLLCSDAVPDADHIAQGRVLDGAADVDQARESFAEALEIADVLICGRDGLVINPTKRPF
ncbi:MAG: MBL fold metallo-hydrolase [Planctomycetota bacterium]